jgi:transcriptional regulator with XRE-family HTH domain
MSDSLTTSQEFIAAVRSTIDFGTHLRSARRTRGITQAQAAVLAGVGVRLWNEAENGRRAQVGLETALRMLEVVGIELRIATVRNAGQDGMREPAAGTEELPQPIR